MGPKNAYAIVLTKSTLHLQHLAATPDIDYAVSAHLAAIAKGAEDLESARKVYSLLIAPLKAELAGKARLLISPDGDLHRLPFETLADSSAKRILDSKIVTYVPSANVLALLRRTGSGSKAPSLLLAVSSSPASAKPVALMSPMSSSEFPGSGNKRGVFDADDLMLKPLPAANDEIRTVANAFGGGGVLLMDATESQFKHQDLASFRVIHLALHGLISTRMPDRSALVFRPDANDDGFLQAREIARLHFRAALVTLSACETGSGKVNGEEGVESLVRPFLLAGARSVVANLWDVDDEFSRGLMKRFYASLAAGNDRDVALQQAKREMIRDYGTQSPSRLWSGFVLVGDGSGPVFGKENGGA
jgi:CHAT domain-containing protein